MTDPRKGPHTIATRIWLMLAEHGGWWTAMEVRDKFSTELTINRATWTLLAMLDRGEVARLDRIHPQYGIKPTCIVPRGVSAEQLLKALGATS